MPQKIKKLLFSCRWIGKHMFHTHIHLQQHLCEIRCEVPPSVFMWCTKSATHIYTRSHLQRHTHTVHPNCITLLWSSQWKYSFLMNNPISTWKVTSGNIGESFVFWMNEYPSQWAGWWEVNAHFTTRLETRVLFAGHLCFLFCVFPLPSLTISPFLCAHVKALTLFQL